MKTAVRFFLVNACVAAAVPMAFVPRPIAAAEPQTLTVTLVTTFDHPTPSLHIFNIGGINDRGDIVGDVASLQGQGPFVRKGNGAFTGFLPALRQVLLPTGVGINRQLSICGNYDPGDDQPFIGFFLIGTTFTSYSVSGSFGTSLNAINDNGDFVGSYGQLDGISIAFASIGGNLITIPAPNGSSGATGINNRGEVVGFTHLHGFLRELDGTIVTGLTMPGAVFTVPQGINNDDVIVGYYQGPRVNAQLHAFALVLPKSFVIYDFPGAEDTVFTGINNNGYIAGFYRDNSQVVHGLIAKVSRQ